MLIRIEHLSGKKSYWLIEFLSVLIPITFFSLNSSMRTRYDENENIFMFFLNIYWVSRLFENCELASASARLARASARCRAQARAAARKRAHARARAHKRARAHARTRASARSNLTPATRPLKIAKAPKCTSPKGIWHQVHLISINRLISRSH